MSLRIRHLAYLCGIISAFFLLVIGIANGMVFLLSGSIYHQIDDVPTTTAAIVLGGGMVSPGMMSEFQTDRVLQAVRLYEAGKVEQLIMSGDDGNFRDNEVDFMKELAVAKGVPAEDVLIDPHAYRTYLSCYRAKHEFGIERTVVITQDFHLPRTIYLCRGMGIETVGFSANLRSDYAHMPKIQMREIFARVKAVWQLMITQPDK